MSLLLNYSENKTNNNSNILEFKDLINDSRLKINKNTRAKSNDLFNTEEMFNKYSITKKEESDDKFDKDGNDDFKNNRLNQNIIVNQKESFDTTNSTINSLTKENTDLKKKLKMIYEKDEIIHKLNIENQKQKKILEFYDKLESEKNNLEITNSELRKDMDSMINQIVNQEALEKENFLIKKQLIKMDSEIKNKISELNDLEIKYSVLIDKYKEIEYNNMQEIKSNKEKQSIINNLTKNKINEVVPQISKSSIDFLSPKINIYDDKMTNLRNVPKVKIDNSNKLFNNFDIDNITKKNNIDSKIIEIEDMKQQELGKQQEFGKQEEFVKQQELGKQQEFGKQELGKQQINKYKAVKQESSDEESSDEESSDDSDSE